MFQKLSLFVNLLLMIASKNEFLTKRNLNLLTQKDEYITTEFENSQYRAMDLNYNPKVVMLPDNKTLISVLLRKDFIASFVAYDIGSSTYKDDFKVPFKSEYFIGKHVCESPGAKNIDLPFTHYVDGEEVFLSIFLSSNSGSDYQDYLLHKCEEEYMTLYMIKYNYKANLFSLVDKKNNFFKPKPDSPHSSLDKNLNTFAIVKNILQLKVQENVPHHMACLVIFIYKNNM